MNEQTSTEPNPIIVGYDPKHQTAAEIWSKDESLFCRMPWGEIYHGRAANKVLKEAVQTKRIQVREVKE